mmetsp:Transcript_10146/g.26797  ORF Transcript_10146/g.26797 Transcript_10146/m.26797 type:complete len:226 (-) Transcript_10146:264-941(-)
MKTTFLNTRCCNLISRCMDPSHSCGPTPGPERAECWNPLHEADRPAPQQAPRLRSTCARGLADLDTEDAQVLELGQRHKLVLERHAVVRLDSVLDPPRVGLVRAQVLHLDGFVHLAPRPEPELDPLLDHLFALPPAHLGGHLRVLPSELVVVALVKHLVDQLHAPRLDQLVEHGDLCALDVDLHCDVVVRPQVVAQPLVEVHCVDTHREQAAAGELDVFRVSLDL